MKRRIIKVSNESVLGRPGSSMDISELTELVNELAGRVRKKLTGESTTGLGYQAEAGHGLIHQGETIRFTCDLQDDLITPELLKYDDDKVLIRALIDESVEQELRFFSNIYRRISVRRYREVDSNKGYLGIITVTLM